MIGAAALTLLAMLGQQTPEQAVLAHAAELVERGWTQDALARDAQRRRCLPGDSKAVCWCLAGSVMRAQQDLGLEPEVWRSAYSKARLYMQRRGISNAILWQDQPGRTKEQVTAMLRGAASL